MVSTKKPLTTAGYSKLASEYRHLWDHERPKVVQGVATAAAEGDRSENAEYIYGKKRLREIDKRLRYLTSLLDDVEVVDPKLLSGSIVCFGCHIKVLDQNNQYRQWQIVGEGEAEADGKTISWRSPVAKALLGKKVGDYIELSVNKRDLCFEIIDLWFGDPPKNT
jgi:transcription elongation factor GreB